MDKTFLGSQVETFLPGIESLPINKVEILDENGDVLAEVSSSSISNGKTLSVVNPDGTQAMAEFILSKTEGYVQRSYEGRNALLDPAAELGDAVTVGGIYSVIAEQNLMLDELYRVDISAPAADEIDDEYPYKSSIQRLIERNMATTKSLITKSNEQIELKIQGVDEKYTSLKVTLDGVTIAGPDGTTLINGGKIKANSVTADQIDATNLKVSAANITGSLTIGQLPDDIAQTNDIPSKISQLRNDSGYQTELGVTSIIKGTVTTDYIYALGIEASTLRGSTIALKDSMGNTVGGFTLAYTTSGDGLGMTTLVGGINISSGANVYIASAYNTRLQLDSQAAKIGPTVWATDGTVIYSSDKNVKNNIEYDLSKYRQFLLDLKPCRFKYNEGQSDRFHIGLIAQDVEQSLKDNHIDPKEFAGWCKMENLSKKGTYTYGIRYDDIVPLNTMMIQELIRRVTALEERS